MASLSYLKQDAEITLGEAIAEHRAAQAATGNFQDVDQLSEDLAESWRAHDMAHALFGCGQGFDDEILVDTWCLAATTLSPVQWWRCYGSTPFARDLF